MTRIPALRASDLTAEHARYRIRWYVSRRLAERPRRPPWQRMTSGVDRIADTLEDAHAAAEQVVATFRRYDASPGRVWQVTVWPVVVAPDRRPVAQAAVAGGTWGGRCGADLWLHDDSNVRYAVPLGAHADGANDHVRMVRAWWGNSRNPTLAQFAAPTVGYRVGCTRPHRHDGPHASLPRHRRDLEPTSLDTCWDDRFAWRHAWRLWAIHKHDGCVHVCEGVAA